ncbi:hypothetical protein [Ferruginibacter sp. HRS2-29]|uniref:hypothetical protein n=1 Tax=Ferruginibacter sp. HRS2-29 TaxID=2487334 RepID=UPI0020CC10DA|nr:hypothetical protein [Ferruginibacter sp. HRS2-29]MCP9752907.1 hypothetical protein [Ferruginibacter sp. HRS2-29]
MKNIFFLFAAIVIVAASCAPKIYKTEDFESKTASHKIVAILPAEVTIALRPNEKKRTTVEQLRESEEKTGTMIQDKMYSWFLRRSGKFKYTVQFQDISKTNALLLQNNIRYADMKAHTKEELAKLLGVDAVISTSASMQKPMSEGAAVAMSLLIGYAGSTNDVQTAISINEATKGDLVWKYDYNATGSVGSNPDRLVNALMRNASKKFPYNDK